MKETGIIMSGDHPRKILDGTKTMTRRTWGLEKINKSPDEWVQPWQLSFESDLWTWRSTQTGEVITIKCPYGYIGDLLWVRETYAVRTDGVDQILYKADYDSIVEMLELDEFVKRMGYPPLSIKWKPSIHMFRKDSRIEREITGLRAERLQEINEADALFEGIEPFKYDLVHLDKLPVQKFHNLWDSLNAKRGYGWDFNPWVWPISF
ncbi:hypothetical protein KKF82_08300 [Patescibacteria group bacterium]|nr:hypothetical protein [Patescibacteria group bacterium]